LSQQSEIMRHEHILHRTSAVLIVIDMQEPFVKSVVDPTGFLRDVTVLVEGFRIMEIPIIGTTQYVNRMGDILPEIRRFLPRTPSHDKLVFDCCGSDSFLAELKASGATQVVLCGLESHICVNQTAHGLLARGYQVHVVADAISSREESNRLIGIEKMKQSGVLVSSKEMALYELLYEAGCPNFKQVLNLVK